MLLLECGGWPDAINGHFFHEADKSPPFQLRDRVRIKCNRGYTSNHPYSKCTHLNNVATWTPASIACEPISCPPPPPLENGFHKGTLYTFPNGITFGCDKGFKLVTDSGLATHYCSATGQWQPKINQPTCMPVTCKTLPDPPNGKIEQDPASFFGATAKYFCDPGFELVGKHGPQSVGNNTRTCGSDGLWDGQDMRCSKSICPQLPRSLQFLYWSEDYAVFQCGNQQRSIKCLPTGKWSLDPPYCHEEITKVILPTQKLPNWISIFGAALFLVFTAALVWLGKKLRERSRFHSTPLVSP